jgi:hypothetical protein
MALRRAVGMGEEAPPSGWVYFYPTPDVGDPQFVSAYVYDRQVWIQMLAKCAGIGWIYFNGAQAWSNDKQVWLPTFSVCGG